MAISLLTNQSATVATNNMATVSAQLQKSLNRLSSGSKIVNPSDDAGGLAVSMKMGAAIKRQAAASTNISNAISYLQTQDGALSTANKILDRMSELKTLSLDVTKNSTDKANYNTEFKALQEQLSSLQEETFNGVSLFSSTQLSVPTTENGGEVVEIGGVNLLGEVTAPSPIFEDSFSGSSLSGSWTIESGSPTVSGGELSLSAYDEVSISNPFSEDLKVSFEFSVNSASDFRVENDSPYFFIFGGSDVAADTWYSIDFNLSTDGTMSQLTVDGSAFTPASGVNPSSSGPISFTLHGGGGMGSTKFRNLSIQDAAASSTSNANVGTAVAASDLDSLDLTTITSAIEDVATHRASNGAQQSRLQFAQEQLKVNQSNLESANSRIRDVDVASESTQLARFNILQQAGAAMLTQANQSSQLALRLLG